MMKKIAWTLAGSAWFGLVFLVALRVTFPSQAVIDRIRWTVQEETGGQMALDMDSIGPWWTGASATNVDLARVGPNGPEPLFFAETAYARVGLFSLIRQAPYITGAVGFGQGELAFDTELKAKDQVITISGIAESNNRVSSLMRRLDGSDWFHEPNLEGVRAAPDYGDQATTFNMTVKLQLPSTDDAEEV